MTRFALLACLACVSAAQAAAPGIRAQLQGPVTKYIQANVKENMGLYLVEDSDQVNAWMADFESFDWAALRRLSASEYIVRAKFVEKPAAGEKDGARAVLKIDYTLKPGKKGWRVAAEALQSVNGKEYFNYDEYGERVYADPSETLNVSIEGAADSDSKDKENPDGDASTESDSPEDSEGDDEQESEEEDEEANANANLFKNRPSMGGNYDKTKDWLPGQKGYEGVGNAPDSGQGAQSGAGVNPYQR